MILFVEVDGHENTAWDLVTFKKQCSRSHDNDSIIESPFSFTLKINKNENNFQDFATCKAKFMQQDF